MFDGGLLVLVQMHLNQLGAVELDTDTLANDFSREDKILQDGIVDSGQSAGAWTLLFQRIARLAGWLGQNLALTDDNNVLARELLLQFAHQNDLDLLEHLLLWNGHVDDDGLWSDGKLPLVKRSFNRLVSSITHLLAAKFNLACTSDVQIAQIGLQVAVGLKLNERLGNRLLELIGI